MGSSTQTPTVGLPQFGDNDKPTWRGDINGAFSAIDAEFVTQNVRLNGFDSQFAALPATIDARIDGRAPVHLGKKYGVSTTNTGAQNYTAMQNAVAAGETYLIFPPGDIPMTMPAEGDFMLSFVNKNKIRILGNGTRIIDSTVYTNNGGITGLFSFSNCVDVVISGPEYVGPVLASPTTLHGYQGATLVSAMAGSKDFIIDMRATNCRYGLLTGNYAVPAQGLCSGFKVRIHGSMIGYGIAAYNADNIKHDLDIDGIHRVGYFAGCDNVRGVARWRDQYIAPIAYLLTDALTSGTDAAAQADPVNSATTSRGCSNIRSVVIDKGSTVFQTTTQCAGIGLSRVDPMRFENIDITVYTKATNTISTKVGGFSITSSGVSAIWSRYPQGWTQNVIIDGLTIRGIVDHSAVTNGDTGNSTGELYLNTWDDVAGPTYYATVRRVEIDGFTYLKSPASTRAVFIGMREPAVPIRVNQLNAPGAVVSVNTSVTVPTTFENCTFDTLSIFGAIASLIQLGAGNTINKQSGPFPIRVSGASHGVGNAGALMMQKEITISPNGANYSWTNAIPAGSVVLGVQSYIETALVGATGYQLGITGDLTRYANKTGTAVGTTTSVSDYEATETFPRLYPGNNHLIVTANGGNFTGGSIRIVITYWLFTALTG
jgi:hypothetical protein